MNRLELRKLALLRVGDAESLYANRRYPAAYYLTGYAVECALKACIARNTRRGEFPDFTKVQRSYSHKLEHLVEVAGLTQELVIMTKSNALFEANWALTSTWKSESRYAFHTRTEARDLIVAVDDNQGGVLTWLKIHW